MRAPLLAGVALMLTAGAAAAQRVTKVDGARLLEICTSSNRGLAMSCEAYIDGVSDTVTLYQEAAPRQGDARVPDTICVPPATTGGQLRDEVVSFLRQHADARPRPAAQVVTRVLRERHPCH